MTKVLRQMVIVQVVGRGTAAVGRWLDSNLSTIGPALSADEVASAWVDSNFDISLEKGETLAAAISKKFKGVEWVGEKSEPSCVLIFVDTWYPPEDLPAKKNVWKLAPSEARYVLKAPAA